jgi:hypothetical protein
MKIVPKASTGTVPATGTLGQNVDFEGVGALFEARKHQQNPLRTGLLYPIY